MYALDSELKWDDHETRFLNLLTINSVLVTLVALSKNSFIIYEL